MNRVLVLVEGDTELSFVDYILRPELETKGVFLSSTLFRKKHKGSFGYQNCQKRIQNSIKQDPSVYVTTFIDYYQMPKDWPGRKESQTFKNYKDKAQQVENALLQDIAAQMDNDWNYERFIPYVQMHEFEALLFSDISILAGDDPSIILRLTSILGSFSCPEEINNNTCPSRRIKQYRKDYNKVVEGILAAKKIGLPKMREKCPHFNEWIEKLEGIGGTI